MERPAARRPALDLLAEAPGLGMAIAVVVLLVRTFLGRVAHPYDLEWMEGGMLTHAQRLLEGQALYVEPTSDFIPFIYPPLYHWLLAAVSLVTGLDYAPGRAISFVGTLLGAAALATAVRGEGTRASWGLGIVVAALFLTGYDDAGSFYDLVRIDGLLVALWGWSLVSIRHGWLRTGGLLLTLAFLTKHNAAAFGLPALIWLWKEEGRTKALTFAAWSVLPALAATAALQLEGDGLFLTYILVVPGFHGFAPERFFPGSPLELFSAYQWVTVLMLVVLPLASRDKLGLSLSAGHRFWLWNGLLAILLSMVMRGHQGGYLNVLIPGLWMLALLDGLAIDLVRQRAAAWKHGPLAARAATSVLVAVQLGLGMWNPDKYLPDANDVEAGDRLVAKIAAIEGEVWAPWSPWLIHKAGKGPSLHLIGLWDVDHKGSPLHYGLDRVKDDIKNQRWEVILTSGGKPRYDMERSYRKADRVRPAGNALRPKVGWRTRPDSFWRPIDARPETETAPPDDGSPVGDPDAE